MFFTIGDIYILVRLNALKNDMWYYKNHIIFKKMDTIIALFLVRTQDYLRPADRDALRKIDSKWKFLRHYNDCECIEQWIMMQAHLVLHALFSETTDKTEILHDIKGDMK